MRKSFGAVSFITALGGPVSEMVVPDKELLVSDGRQTVMELMTSRSLSR